MVVGFNHNFSYKGQVYHVQTEDSGVKNPHIITLLYRGGTILSSKKTSYADIIKVDKLEVVVEELMKSQHREMLRLLKNGDLDELLGLTPAKPKTATNAGAPPPPREKIAPVIPPPLVAATPTAVTPIDARPPSTPPVTTTATTPRTPPLTPPEKQKPGPPPSPPGLSLDEIIFSYMIGEEKKR
jgi:hypothetical protein